MDTENIVYLVTYLLFVLVGEDNNVGIFHIIEAVIVNNRGNFVVVVEDNDMFFQSEMSA